MSLKLIKVETKPHGTVATYKVVGCQPGRDGICVDQEAEFTFHTHGKVTATMTFEGMPDQETFEGAKRRLTLYCQLMAKGLRQSKKPKQSIPLYRER